MPRYKMVVEYDGVPYVGWQRQDNGKSVQGAIEKAIFAMSGEEVSLRAAGRTDSGVHAFGQVCHVDLSRDWKASTVANAINAHLAMEEERVAILSAEQVPTTFDARFSATKRHYLYRIINRMAPSAIDAERAWHVKKPLDAERMHEAAQEFVGHHDFTTFRSSHCQAKNPRRTIERVEVSRNGDYVEIRASAQSFLHNQIRSFAGTLKMAGEGKWSALDIREALLARDRARCGPVAPPHGLFFMQVDYGDLSTLLTLDDDESAEG
ncbi:tRNA pseudouridine38-40 synthase [Rhizobium sp. SG_E_25_P2]|jgi:tRNA pseudouridine38-40 synthase|uniref:tRNA pseudouridine(38-40) synthase TruA n=1 Tax=Rhizobium sp. SG_E_25_P2 TaxID=2879942 RepID=UPI002474D02D|nr:tRNA pseudouridine(38-40) synthase TruA [Rhizobium sp. SG_E_25_P2]MDH6264883.1 tRNA pseudouridine38-40 synthase [Rhizobium sp. SG_E_25_P2]